MKVVITIDDIHAYTEVDYIINHMNQRYIDMIPEKLLEFFTNLSDPNYEVNVNPRLPLENQGLQRYALEILAILHLKYWCQNEERKQELYNLMLSNNGEEKLNEHFKYRDSIEGLFINKKEEPEEPEETEKVDYSTPRVIQKYDVFSKENEDIKDYTDVAEDEPTNLPVDNEQTETKGFFTRIKEKILSLFRK